MKAGLSVVDPAKDLRQLECTQFPFRQDSGTGSSCNPFSRMVASAETFALALLFQPGPCWKRGICDGDLSSDGFNACQKLESPADLHAMQSWGSVPAAEPRNSSKVTQLGRREHGSHR